MKKIISIIAIIIVVSSFFAIGTFASDDEYLVIDDCTDFELYDYVIFDAYVGGVKESIKVREVYEWNGSTKTEKYNFADLGYGKLSAALSNVLGIYTYSIDDDGFYVLTEVATVSDNIIAI